MLQGAVHAAAAGAYAEGGTMGQLGDVARVDGDVVAVGLDN